jgi:hypothetical protein
MSDVENQAVEAADDWTVDTNEEVAEAEVVEEVTEEVTDETTEEAATESDELELVIDGEAVPPTADEDEIELPEDAPTWAQQLRQRQKELARENKQLKQQAATGAATVEQTYEPQEMEEPTLESCNWDETEFRQKTKEWALHQAKTEERKAKQLAEQESFAAELQKKQQSYAVRKAEVLKQAPDYTAAEAAVTAALSPATQNMILDLAKDPAAVVLAAGRNKAILSELASLQTNPIKLAAKIGELNRTASFAPKAKKQFGAEPSVRASTTKPQSASDAAFSAAFPDAKFS